MLLLTPPAKDTVNGRENGIVLFRGWWLSCLDKVIVTETVSIDVTLESVVHGRSIRDLLM